MKKTLIKGISWLAVLAIFCWVLVGIVPQEQAQNLSFLQKVQFALNLLYETLAQARLFHLLALCLTYMLFLVCMETTGTAWLIRRFNCPMRFKEMLPARAITFLLAVLNYQVGQLAIPLYLKRMYKVPLVEGMGSIFFLGAMDLFIVILLGTCGAFFMGEENFTRQILIVGTCGILFYISHALFWRFERLVRVLWKILEKIPFFGKWLAQPALFHAFQKARFQDYLTLFFLRIPIVLAILLSLYGVIYCFRGHVPLTAIFVYAPVVMLISTVPIINVGSIGASQASVVYFFKDYASESILLAVSLTWALAINLLKVLVGAIFLNKHSAALFRPDPEK